MGLVVGKCTQCGASIEFDSSKKTGVCPHCETKYLTKDITVNNITNYSFNETINGKNVNRVAVLEKMLIKYYNKEFNDIDNLKEYSFRVLELDNNNSLANFVAFKSIAKDDDMINFINEGRFEISLKLFLAFLINIQPEKLFKLKIDNLLSNHTKQDFDLFRGFLLEPVNKNVIRDSYEKILEIHSGYNYRFYC